VKGIVELSEAEAYIIAVLVERRLPDGRNALIILLNIAAAQRYFLMKLLLSQLTLGDIPCDSGEAYERAFGVMVY
jgi:hypothetical protein